MRFNPSSHSYGDGQVTITPVDVPAEQSSGGGGAGMAQAGQFVDIGVSAVRSVLGLDSDGREDVATLEAQLANYRASAARAPSMSIGGIPIPGGKEHYQNLVRKTESKLTAARVVAAEEQRAAAAAEARDIGYTLAVFAGVLVIGGIAVNQVQKSRRTQAEIDRLRASN